MGVLKLLIFISQGPTWYETRTKVNPVMLQPKTAKKYIEPVEEIAEDFIERIRSIRDEKDEVPAEFSNEMNKWALESIARIGLETRLGLLGEIPKDSDGQKLIQVNYSFCVVYFYNRLNLFLECPRFLQLIV